MLGGVLTKVSTREYRIHSVITPAMSDFDTIAKQFTGQSKTPEA
jgi:hypothetical protein